MSTREAFVVQLVRMRQRAGGRAKPALQTLKKVLRMRIYAVELLISVPKSAPPAAPTRTSSILRYFAPTRPASSASSQAKESIWLSIESRLVKSVNVKGRMLKAVLQGGQALILCLKDASEAVEAATAMMNAWGIEPLVETNGVEKEHTISMAQLSKLYISNSHFRSLVHQMHSQIESLDSENSSFSMSSQ